MLAASHYPVKSKLHQQYWIDQHSIQIPWLNFLTSQSIPEETDSSECSRSHRTESESSSSSEESYIILEITQPDKSRQLNYAEIIEYKQCVQPLIIEVQQIVISINLIILFLLRYRSRSAQLNINANQ